MDPLSDILAILKPESYLTAALDAGGEWAIRFANRPGTIKCHAVTAGACWLAVDGMDGAVRLTAGDCIILPSGRPFMLASDLKLDPAQAQDVLGQARSGDHRVLEVGLPITATASRHFETSLNVDHLSSPFSCASEQRRAARIEGGFQELLTTS